jgi:hypothetical protein
MQKMKWLKILTGIILVVFIALTAGQFINRPVTAGDQEDEKVID